MAIPSFDSVGLPDVGQFFAEWGDFRIGIGLWRVLYLRLREEQRRPQVVKDRLRGKGALRYVVFAVQ